MSSVLIVDAANVVGSRPDGWWRDRPGAARRLHDQLSSLTDSPDRRLILVLEGQARAGVPTGTVGRIETVHAERDGDGAIADLVAGLTGGGTKNAEVTVVTADRGLSDRVRILGGEVRRPGWLLAQLG